MWQHPGQAEMKASIPGFLWRAPAHPYTYLSRAHPAKIFIWKGRSIQYNDEDQDCQENRLKVDTLYPWWQ